MKWLKRKDSDQPRLSLEEIRSQKLSELGAKLSASRQEKGLSLEEMVVLTKIPRRLLQAIEEGNLDELPEPIYIQGLIRQFADALGFNAVEFALDFPIASGPIISEPPGKIRFMSQLRPLHLYLLYIFVIVCSVSSLSQLLNNADLKANNTESKPQQQTSLKTEPTQTQSTAKAQPVSDTLSSIKDNQSLQISVTLKASSWIRVVADGKTEFEGVLPEGTRRVWKAQEQLTVKTDNAGGVMMSVNQEKAKQMGEPGKVEEVKIAAKPQP
ncbi:helix-turn-helix domain-containing protein [Nostoc sp. UHCC 0702]|nr:helix-turn-helix domain-containing protein [Nostoc sp. UHCC 0702]